MPRDVTTYWSSCCGALADYLGFYRCRECGQALSMGRAREPHLLSVKPGEAPAPGRPRDVQPVLPLEVPRG